MDPKPQNYKKVSRYLISGSSVLLSANLKDYMSLIKSVYPQMLRKAEINLNYHKNLCFVFPLKATFVCEWENYPED